MDIPSAVRARSITKSFGEVVALDAVDLDIPAGRLHGLVGPNGAGKTTLLGLLLGLAVADSGDLEVLGAPVSRVLGVPEGVAGFVDAPGLYPSLTARQNLQAVADLRGIDRRSAQVDEALDQVGLADVADDRLRGFSLGMRQRLGLAAALLTRPRLLVLDEPSNGLDPAGKHHVHQVLRGLADAGTAVVISSHHMDDLAALCSEVTILARGCVVYSGAIGELAGAIRTLDYRIVTSDPATAHLVARQVDGLTELTDRDPARPDEGAVHVRGPQQAVDRCVAELVGHGVAIRELGPMIPPLEAAFLTLTGTDPVRRPSTATDADLGTDQHSTPVGAR